MLEPITAPITEWRDPDTDPPPINKKILLLTLHGTACIGHWYAPGFLAWAPLPKVPEKIKKKSEIVYD